MGEIMTIERMRKVATASVALAVGLGTAACGGNSVQESGESPSPTSVGTTQTPEVSGGVTLAENCKYSQDNPQKLVGNIALVYATCDNDPSKPVQVWSEANQQSTVVGKVNTGEKLTWICKEPGEAIQDGLGTPANDEGDPHQSKTWVTFKTDDIERAKIPEAYIGFLPKSNPIPDCPPTS